MKNLFQYISIRHMKMRPGRAAFSILGIACGIALFVAISIINDSTSNYFKDSMAAVSGKAALQITAGDLGFAEKVAADVEAVEGVKDAVPVIENRSWLLSTNESLMVMGVDLLQEKQVRDYKSEGKKIIGDAMMFMARPDSLILTENFAKAHHLKMDDKLELSTAKGKGTFTVRGILAPTGLATAYGGGLAIMDIDSARLAFGKENKIDRIDIVPTKGADIEKLATALRAKLGPSFSVERPELASAQMERMTRSFQFLSHFFSTLALIVGVFLISNSVSISVAERRKEIGTLRALGTKRVGILILFIAEAATMGILGALLGAFGGRVVSTFLVNGVTRAMSEQYHTQFQAAVLKFGPDTVLMAVAVGAIASIVAAILPSIKATRVAPVEAMKRKETGEQGRATGWARFSGLFGFGLLGFSVVASLMINDSEMRILQISMQLAAIVGAALVGPELVIRMVQLLQPLAVKSQNIIPRIALDNILRNPRRTATNVTSLMVGLTLVVIIACVNVSFKGTVLRFFGRILHADLIISTTGRLQSNETQPLNENLRGLIEQNPAVLGAYELREVNLMYEGDKLLLKYYGEPPIPDKEGERRYEIFDTIDRDSEAAGEALYHAAEPTIIASQNFAIHYHKKTGELVELLTPKGVKSFRIAAIVNEYANPFGTLFMSRATYKALWNDTLVSGFAVKLKKGNDPVAVRTELDRALSKQYKLTILSNADIRNQVSSVIDSSFAYTHAIELAALLVALLGLSNTLLITVMERTRELGLGRAIGMTRKHISQMILIEAASQGSLGALVALVLGTGLGVLWVTHNLAHSLGWVVNFFFPWQALFTTFALGLVVTMVAAWYPARRASGIDIVDALDYE